MAQATPTRWAWSRTPSTWGGALLLTGLALPATAPAGPSHARPSHDGPVRGVALGLFASDPAWDYAGLLDELAARGARDVLLVVNGFQRDRAANEIHLRPGHSPSPQTLARTLDQVRARGMRAALMPVVRLAHREPGDWRGVLAPRAGPDAWFRGYRRFVLPLARAAAQHGAARFVVGSELGSLEPHARHFRALIAELRTVFPGTLTYSANWDRAAHVTFWDALDELGVTAYFPLTQGVASPSADQLARAFKRPIAELAALSERTGKPLLVTEIGYASQQHSGDHPWDETRPHPIDLPLQRRLYRAACEALGELTRLQPRTRGFYFWNWFGRGGPRDRGFSPRGKPAAGALSACLRDT